MLRLSESSEPIAWHDQAEAKQYADAGRWTMFDKPVYLPRACQSGTDHVVSRQPMIVYIDESLLDAADRLPRPPLSGGDNMIWRKLGEHSAKVQAACASDDSVGKLMNDWATSLLKRFDAMHRLSRDERYLHRIADMALCAATERPLRWKLYLRYATAQEQDRVRRTFDTFIAREFPNITWDKFIAKLRSLNDVLGALLPRMPEGPVATSHPATALPKIRNISSAPVLTQYQLNAR